MINACAANFGNVQLFDSQNGKLKIVAQYGFGTEFMGYFGTVNCKHGCVCSAAMNNRSRIVVTDVATDSLLTDESRGVLLRAKVRSVQSTPLIEPSGKFVGMVSTHYSHPGGPTPDVLQNVDAVVATFVAKRDSHVVARLALSQTAPET